MEINSADWAQPISGGVGLLLHCQPGARVTRIVGEHGGRLKVALHAPAVDNKANEALVAWLSECLGVPRRQLDIVSGHTSRQKKVVIQGVDLQSVIRALNQ